MVPPEIPSEKSKRQQRGVLLAEAYFHARKDKDTAAYARAREELADYCCRFMTMLVRASVYGRGSYPRGIGPQIFAEECISALHEKFTEGIDTLKSPDKIIPFLRSMVLYAMIERWRYYKRRPQEPLERVVVDDEGQEIIQILDEAGRDAALRHLGASLGLLAEADKWARAIENRVFLEQALAEYVASKEGDTESGLWVQNTWENPKLTFENIAKARKTSSRTARRFLKKDNLAVLKIGKKNLEKISPTHAEAPAS